MRITYTLFLALALSPLTGQVNLGIKAGFNTTQVNPENLSIMDPGTFETFGLEVREAKYGIHLGVYLKAHIGETFFIQPEVLLNSNSTSYMLTALSTEQVLEENFQYIDIPFMLGWDFGVFNIQAGPVGHVFLSSTSELNSLAGFQSKWEDLLWGWQAGIGFDIWRFNLDIRYEGNFYKYGDHVQFFGQQYNFSDSPKRVITSLSFLF